MSAIYIENLVKSYGTVRALDGLTLEVDRGSIFGFLGPNGAGKDHHHPHFDGAGAPN